MGRKKGSVNKPKIVPIGTLSKEVVKVQPEIIVNQCVECKHVDKIHYGGPKGWCNTKDCQCQEFK